MMLSRFSVAPATLPGRFTMSAVPRMAAWARESGAIEVFLSEALRINSPNPGTARSHTDIVASGVTSRGAIPVPPVVTTSRAESPVAVSIAVAICSISSGTIMTASTSNPAAVSICLTAGPERSSRSPREAVSLHVITRARIIARDSA